MLIYKFRVIWLWSLLTKSKICQWESDFRILVFQRILIIFEAFIIVKSLIISCAKTTVIWQLLLCLCWFAIYLILWLVEISNYSGGLSETVLSLRNHFFLLASFPPFALSPFLFSIECRLSGFLQRMQLQMRGRRWIWCRLFLLSNPSKFLFPHLLNFL